MCDKPCRGSDGWGSEIVTGVRQLADEIEWTCEICREARWVANTWT